MPAAVGRILPPQDVQALIPGTCDYVMLHGKKDLADVIKVTDLQLGRRLWISQVSTI